MDREYLNALYNVLEDMTHSKNRSYRTERIEEIAPQYAKAICCYLKDNNVATFTTSGMIIKPNGTLEYLLQDCKGKLTESKQAEKDHAFARFRDWVSIVISVASLIISIFALYRTYMH